MSESTLYWACRRGDNPLATESMVRLIHDVDSAKYVHPDLGDTPLHQACKQGWLNVVKLLIERCHVDPEVTDNLHQSPLHYACQHGHMDIVKYLIERGCNPLLRSNKQLEPLDYALNSDHTDIAMYICRSSISSAMLLMPERSETTENLLKKIALLPFYPLIWRTCDSGVIFYLACTSKLYTVCIPSSVMQMLLERNGVALDVMRPDWKTANGDTIFHLVCQS